MIYFDQWPIYTMGNEAMQSLERICETGKEEIASENLVNSNTYT